MALRASRTLLVAATLAVAAGACTDLTVEPKSTINAGNIFNDPTSYKAFLAKLYAGLAVTGQQGAAGNADIQGIDEGFSHYLRQYWQLQELPTDEAGIGWNDPGLPELSKQTWAANNVFVAAMYSRIFFQISMTNEFLRQTTDDKLTSRGVSAGLKDTVHTYRAEARFLRALSYWHGMDLYGDIPLVDENFVIGSNPPPQATRAQVYDFVVSELTAIIPQLPATPQYGRAGKAAAEMLLANVQLNAAVYTGTAKWTEAMTAASAAIADCGCTLASDWSNLFKADNNTQSELIFTVTQDGVHTQTWGGMTFLIHASIGGDMNASVYGIDGGWWGLRAKQEFPAKFGAGDTRAVFFRTNQDSVMTDLLTFSKGYPYPKYSNRTSSGAAGSNSTFPDTDFPIFRLGEAYLIYAEAVTRGATGGNAATALGYVNALRTRASAGTITSGQLTTAFILDERARELGWEAHRRQDLIRYGLFTGGTYTWAYKGGTPAGGSTDAHLNLYPIPSNELIANPNLHQNPGY